MSAVSPATWGATGMAAPPVGAAVASTAHHLLRLENPFSAENAARTGIATAVASAPGLLQAGQVPILEGVSVGLVTEATMLYYIEPVKRGLEAKKQLEEADEQMKEALKELYCDQ